MHIFIDESGTFTGVGAASPDTIDVVGALIVPDGQLPELVRRYGEIRGSLAMENGEVKGRANNEEQIAAVVEILRGFDVLFEANAIDLSLTDAGSINEHRKAELREYAAAKALLVERLRSLPDFGAEQELEMLTRLHSLLGSLGDQLYLQSFLTIQLIDRILDLAPAYYSQRRPQELSQFAWVIDGHHATMAVEWESWWSDLILPHLQRESMHHAVMRPRFGDYSAMDRFHVDVRSFDSSTHQQMAARMGIEVDRVLALAAPARNLGLILKENFRFSSAPEPGLELVDILSNAVRRAMRGNLQFPGWRHIRALMIHRPHQYVYLSYFGQSLSGPKAYGDVPYGETLTHFSHGGKDLMTAITYFAHSNFDYWKLSRFNQQLQGRDVFAEWIRWQARR